jgi:hypothetical protein
MCHLCFADGNGPTPNPTFGGGVFEVDSVIHNNYTAGCVHGVRTRLTLFLGKQSRPRKKNSAEREISRKTAFNFPEPLPYSPFPRPNSPKNLVGEKAEAVDCTRTGYRGDRNFVLCLPRLTVLFSIEANRPGAWFPGLLGPYTACFPGIDLSRDF